MQDGSPRESIEKGKGPEEKEPSRQALSQHSQQAENEGFQAEGQEEGEAFVEGDEEGAELNKEEVKSKKDDSEDLELKEKSEDAVPEEDENKERDLNQEIIEEIEQEIKKGELEASDKALQESPRDSQKEHQASDENDQKALINNSFGVPEPRIQSAMPRPQSSWLNDEPKNSQRDEPLVEEEGGDDLFATPEPPKEASSEKNSEKTPQSKSTKKLPQDPNISMKEPTSQSDQNKPEQFFDISQPNPPEPQSLPTEQNNINSEGPQKKVSKTLNRPELFFKRQKDHHAGTKMIVKEKFDNQALMFHANSFMAQHVEAEAAREARRKQFVADFNSNRAHLVSNSPKKINSYQKRFNHQTARSQEQQRVWEELQEKRLNRFKYGEIAQRMNSQASSEHKTFKARPAVSTFKVMQKERQRSLDLMKLRKEVGNEYMKFGNNLAKEKLASNPLSGSPKPLKEEKEDPYLERRKIERKKYSNIQEIFRREQPLELPRAMKPYGNGVNPHSVYSSLRARPDSSLPKHLLRSMDADIKQREQELKEGSERELNIDEAYLHSIQTKIDVLNNEFVEGNYRPPPAKGSKRFENRNAGQKRNNRQSAEPRLRQAYRLPDVDSRVRSANRNRYPEGTKPSEYKAKASEWKMKERPPRLESLEARRKKTNSQTQKSAAIPEVKSSDPNTGLSLNDNPAFERTTLIPKQELGKMKRLPEVERNKDNKPPGESLNNDPSESVGEKEKEKERERREESPEARAYLQGLSEDLDQDPSESIASSEQAKQQRALNQFFEKRME